MFHILEEIEKEINIDFQKLFIETLCMLINMPTFELKEDQTLKNLSNYKRTSEWYDAFTNTCKKTNNIELIKYRRNLSLEEEEIFDKIFLDLIIKNEFIILNNINDKIENNKINDYYNKVTNENRKWLKEIYNF